MTKTAVCIYAGTDGGSRLINLEIPLTRKIIADDGTARWEGIAPASIWGIATGDPNHCTDWHPCGMAGFSITLEGEWDIEATDGARRRLRPGDMLVMLDTTGTGHRSWPTGKSRCLTMGVGFGEGVEERMRALLAETLAAT